MSLQPLLGLLESIHCEVGIVNFSGYLPEELVAPIGDVGVRVCRSPQGIRLADELIESPLGADLSTRWNFRENRALGLRFLNRFEWSR